MCPEKGKYKRNSRNHEKELKSSISKEFARSVSYFEKPANLISKEVMCVYSMSNIKIQISIFDTQYTRLTRFASNS